MSLEPSPHTRHDDSPTTLTAHSPKNGSTPIGVDPELLRWRAEVLLDEMMLGGVDLAAGEPGSHTAWPTTATPSPAARVYENGREATATGTKSYENGQNGTYTPAATGAAPAQPNPGPPLPPSKVSEPIDYFSLEWTERPATPAAPSPQVEEAGANPPQPAPEGQQQWVFSAEERYRRLARQQAEGATAQDSAEPAVNAAGDYLWPDENGTRPAQRESTVGPPTVRRVANQFAGTVAGGAKRSNLLPRMSTADVEAVQREIYTLQNEINTRLPAGHESNKHAHHLLEKALAILQADPARSAEVEYYLQQVRTIFQRVQQTIDWSSVYRNRLLVYVGAWSLLALIFLAARLVYQERMEQSWALIGGFAPDTFAYQQFTTIGAAFFAGALGGALSVLISLHHQNRLPHGFIDRKFGLRGLILPLIGAVSGTLLALVAGLLYTLVGLNPAQNLWWSLLPALGAFLFGITQELIYGTRD